MTAAVVPPLPARAVIIVPVQHDTDSTGSIDHGVVLVLVMMGTEDAQICCVLVFYMPSATRGLSKRMRMEVDAVCIWEHKSASCSFTSMAFSHPDTTLPATEATNQM
jgi:hypothetical protein